MLSVQTIQLLVTGGVVGGVVGFLGAIPYLKKNGVNVDDVLNKAKTIADTSEKILDVADEVLPNNSVVFFLKNIDKWAKIAVGEAQQLSHSGDISSDKRLITAQNAVYTLLEELKIDLTDTRKALINSAIQDAVNNLGHKDKTDAEKEAEKQQLQTQNAQLITENATLKNAITQFTASTIQTITQTAQQ